MSIPHSGVHLSLDTLAEGWHALRQRAGHALTHFFPGNRGALPESRNLEYCARWSLLPAEVREEDGHIVVQIEIPGMDPADFDIQVVDDALTIRGEKRVADDEGRWFLLERAYGHFERMMQLPGEVDANRVEAEYRRGVLSIRLSKLQHRTRRRIPVNPT